MPENPPRTQKPRTIIRISLSDTAYDYLAQAAKNAGYINDESKNNRGLTRYIRALFMMAAQSFEDTRDPAIQIFSTNQLSKDRNPRWYDPDYGPRKQRNFVKELLPLDEMLRIAILHGITSPHRTTFQFEPHQAASNVLEAIGQETLTPKLQPRNLAPARHQHRTPYKEIAW